MYTKKVFKALDLLRWTRFETYGFVVYALLFTFVYTYLDAHWLKIPWTPLALIGTAVAFVVGFQNNSAYGRIWEARKIWGGIVNTSRTFGMMVQDLVESSAANPILDAALHQEKKELIYRHIAWMTALRYAMRALKPWETALSERSNREWAAMISPPERKSTLEADVASYLSKKEMEHISTRSNKQTAILYLQSAHLKKLKDRGLIWEFSFLELEKVLQQLFDLQGKSERIKNFPYPRHFASLNHYFIWIFIMVLPLGIIPQFAEIGIEMVSEMPVLSQYFVWLGVPFYVTVAWIFHTMERIGRTGENPFEGSANDVPISTIARGIEIDMLQNFGEKPEDIPAQFPEIYDVQL